MVGIPSWCVLRNSIGRRVLQGLKSPLYNNHYCVSHLLNLFAVIREEKMVMNREWYSAYKTILRRKKLTDADVSITVKSRRDIAVSKCTSRSANYYSRCIIIQMIPSPRIIITYIHTYVWDTVFSRGQDVHVVLLDCDAMYTRTQIPTFRRYKLPPSSETEVASQRRRTILSNQWMATLC
jgi:hypothetical protein